MTCKLCIQQFACSLVTIAVEFRHQYVFCQTTKAIFAYDLSASSLCILSYRTPIPQAQRNPLNVKMLILVVLLVYITATMATTETMQRIANAECGLYPGSIKLSLSSNVDMTMRNHINSTERKGFHSPSIRYSSYSR